MFEYKNLRWISYGWKYNTARITSGRTPFPNNERWCRGTITTPVFIEFVNIDSNELFDIVFNKKISDSKFLKIIENLTSVGQAKNNEQRN